MRRLFCRGWEKSKTIYFVLNLMGWMGLVVGTASLAWGEAVVVMISSGVAPYQEALTGFRQSATFSYAIVDVSNTSSLNRYLSNPETQLLLAIGTEATKITQSAPPQLPVVYTMVLEPLSLPDRTTFCLPIKIPVNEQFARIQKLFPKYKRVGVLYDPNYSSKDIEAARKCIDQYGLQLFPVAVTERSEVSASLRKMTKENVDIIWMVVDQTVAYPAVLKMMIEHALNNGLIFIGLSVHHVRAGALAAFAADYVDIGRQSSAAAQAVLTKSMKEKIQYPQKVIIFINPYVQQKLGIEDLSSFPEVQVVK